MAEPDHWTERGRATAATNVAAQSPPLFLTTLVLLAAAIVTCTGQQPEFFRAVGIGGSYFGLAIRARTNGWVALESSLDLRNWTEVASNASTNAASLFVDEVNVHAGNRFYRLRLPGTSVEEVEGNWLDIRESKYRFHLQRVSTSRPPFVLTGTVTMVGGQKTITDATADGQPIAQPDPADFPSIYELLSALRAAQRAGCRQVYALYDPVLKYPVRCLIDNRGAVVPPADPGNALEYRISGLENLARP